MAENDADEDGTDGGPIDGTRPTGEDVSYDELDSDESLRTDDTGDFVLADLSGADESTGEIDTSEAAESTASAPLLAPVFGLLLIVLAISGILDDSGVLPHSLWGVAGVLALGVGLATTWSVARKLR